MQSPNILWQHTFPCSFQKSLPPTVPDQLGVRTALYGTSIIQLCEVSIGHMRSREIWNGPIHFVIPLLNSRVQENHSPGLNPEGLHPRQLLIMGGSLMEWAHIKFSPNFFFIPQLNNIELYFFHLRGKVFWLIIVCFVQQDIELYGAIKAWNPLYKGLM